MSHLVNDVDNSICSVVVPGGNLGTIGHDYFLRVGVVNGDPKLVTIVADSCDQILVLHITFVYK